MNKETNGIQDDEGASTQTEIVDVADSKTETETTLEDESQRRGADSELEGGETVTGDGEGESGEVVEGTEGKEESEDYFYHEVPYTANQKEAAFRIEYDKQGNITPESLKELQQMAASAKSTPLAIQTAREEAKRLVRELETEKARVVLWERKHKAYEEAHNPAIEFLRKNPQLVDGLKQKFRMPDLPDPEKLRLSMEVEELRTTAFQSAADRFISDAQAELSAKHPDLTADDWLEVQRGMMEAGLADSISHLALDNPQTRQRYIRAAEREIDSMRFRGRLTNPVVEKAKAETTRREQELERAKKRAAVRNPLAGGGAATAKGKGKEEPDLNAMSRDEQVKYFASLTK